jgi:hypothetical protein
MRLVFNSAYTIREELNAIAIKLTQDEVAEREVLIA